MAKVNFRLEVDEGLLERAIAQIGGSGEVAALLVEELETSTPPLPLMRKCLASQTWFIATHDDQRYHPSINWEDPSE